MQRNTTLRRFATGMVLAAVLMTWAEPAKAETRHEGQSLRVDVDRLSLYRLVGTPREIGYAAGRLMPKASVKEGMVPFMATYVENMVLHSEVLQRNGWLKPMVGAFLDWKYFGRLEANILPAERAYLDGFAAGSGMDRGVATRAFLNPDAITVLVADHLQKRLLPVPVAGVPRPLTLAPALGCASFIVPASQSATGQLLFARGQDYAGVGRFDRFPAVSYIARPGKYRYASIASAGISTGAITAMNEHGLTISVHSAFSLNADVTGTPVLSASAKIMEEARTIEEAVALCRKHVTAGGWLINLADVADGVGRAARVEMDPAGKTCRVIRSTGPMVATNHYQHPESKRREVRIGPSVDRNSVDRQERIQALLEARLSDGDRKVSLEESLRILADRRDLTLGRSVGYAPAAVGALDQIVSACFVPATREIWVSNGLAPTASQGKYLHFRFEDFEHLERIDSRSTKQDIDIRELLAGTENDLANWPAFQTYKKVALALDQHALKDPRAALPLLDEAILLEPAEPLLQFMRGLVHLKVGQVASGFRDLDSIHGSSLLDAHRQHVVALYRAKALDALGRRDEALTGYKALLAEPGVHPPIREVAAKYVAAPCPAARLAAVNPDPKYFDTLGYD